MQLIVWVQMVRWCQNFPLQADVISAPILAKALVIPITADTERITFREAVGQFAGEDSEDETELSIEDSTARSSSSRHHKTQYPKTQTRGGLELRLAMEEMIDISGLAQPVFDEVYLSWVDIEATHFRLYT